ncbi:hypothetical protein STA3757_05430 [Stanieria sp. NIES-3757]|nr:hypothetical protein STA3757_05430 [Stanieria sp. NIES-3757]
MNSKSFCFCTLAVGKRYRAHALLLAKDLEKYASETKLIVLTNQVKYFNNQANIIAFKHQPQSCKLYNDKRIAIAKALTLFNSCIFADADVRIIDQIPEQINFEAGIVAHSCYSILKRNNQINENQSSSNIFQLIQKVALAFNINVEEVKFVQEYFFYVTRDKGFEDFIDYWEIIAGYFELNHIYYGEGNIIGLAAAKANFSIKYDRERKISIFKDRVEKIKIKLGKSNYEEKSQYFDEHQQIEFSQHSLIEKITNKLKKDFGFYYRLICLKIITFKYLQFYKVFDDIKLKE